MNSQQLTPASPPSLMDTHCHLNYDYSPKTLPEILAEAHAAGVSHLVTIGTDLNSIPEIQKISESYDPVFHTLGVHPHDVHLLSEEGLSVLRQAASHPKCRAIGEIGLDYFYEHSTQEQQKYWLERQLQLALDLNLPVIIHSREAEEDLLPRLKTYAKQVAPGSPAGVIHCFSGTRQFGLECIDLGFYLSLSGIITFKKADELRESIREFPLEKLLIETDAPYLAPVPHRGKKCEPSMVSWTALKLAEIKSLPVENIAELTTRNAKQLFRI